MVPTCRLFGMLKVKWGEDESHRDESDSHATSTGYTCNCLYFVRSVRGHKSLGNAFHDKSNVAVGPHCRCKLFNPLPVLLFLNFKQHICLFCNVVAALIMCKYVKRRISSIDNTRRLSVHLSVCLYIKIAMTII